MNHQLNNLEETDKFLEIYYLSRLSHEEAKSEQSYKQ